MGVKVVKNELSRSDFVRWGRTGGKVRSEAKTVACRINAKKVRSKKEKNKLSKN